MIIDSPIVSGSFLSTGSLSQIGNAQITGSLTVSGSAISLVDGSYSGSGANLFGIPATGITGLNLSQISSGSVSASISPNLGLLINTSVSASNFTGSFTGSLTGISTSASYAAFALTSSYSLGGSGFPFSGSAVITGSLLVSGSGLTITGSVSISTLTTGSGVRYVIADANGLISAQTASAAIFVTQQTIATAGQTNFPITNGYSTGYVTVFVNGTKLNADEFTDTSGTNIVLATGSMVNDVVEFQKYLPASGVSNNALRSINYFTTTLGQTNFTVNYTPGLLDVFYNGSKLSNTEYTAANGTSITLATGSNAGDTLEVDVYSYQVGAFSGIGGSGVARELAFYNTSNSITGSNKVTYDGATFSVTGSFLVTGSSTFTVVGPAIFSGSVTAVGGIVGTADSASYATTASYSENAKLFDSRPISIFATTGSNGFTANQAITGSLTVTGTIVAQTLNVQQVTSSIVYSSGSNVFGCDINSRQTFTGSFYQTGSVSAFYSCVGIGTNFPTKALEIFSNVSQDGIKISGASNPRLTIIDTTNSVQFDALTTDTEAVLRTDTNHPLHLSTNGSLRLNITNTGIACFSCQVCAPQLRLSGTTNMILQPSFVGSSNLRNGGAIQYSKNFTIFTDDGVNGCGFDLQYWNGSAYYPGLRLNNVSSGFANLLLLQDGGNVGIGTSSPSQKLEVYNSSGDTSLKIKNASCTGTARLLLNPEGAGAGSTGDGVIFFDMNSTAWVAGVDKSDSSKFKIANDVYGDFRANNYLTITTSGNVGINMTAPSQKLHVIGGFLQTYDNSSWYRNVFERNVSTWDNVVGFTPGSSPQYTYGYINITASGYVNGTSAGGVTTSRWYYSITNNSISVSVVGSDIVTGSQAPSVRLVVSSGTIYVQIQSGTPAATSYSTIFVDAMLASGYVNGTYWTIA